VIRPVGGVRLRRYRAAVESRDIESWLGFLAAGGRWIEYRPGNPSGSARVLAGKSAIRRWLEEIRPVPAELTVSRELVGEMRIAYRLTVTFEADGRRIVEHVIADLDERGQIVCQVDAEIWDEVSNSTSHSR
jgi:SnoaL-like domain